MTRETQKKVLIPLLRYRKCIVKAFSVAIEVSEIEKFVAIVVIAKSPV